MKETFHTVWRKMLARGNRVHIIYIPDDDPFMCYVKMKQDEDINFHPVSCFCVLCQLLKPDEESTSTQRYIDSRTVQPKAKGAWISVEVTETIKDWVSDPGERQHQVSL